MLWENSIIPCVQCGIHNTGKQHPHKVISSQHKICYGRPVQLGLGEKNCGNIFHNKLFEKLPKQACGYLLQVSLHIFTTPTPRQNNKTKPNLNTVVGLDTKMTEQTPPPHHPAHHRNSTLVSRNARQTFIIHILICNKQSPNNNINNNNYNNNTNSILCSLQEPQMNIY